MSLAPKLAALREKFKTLFTPEVEAKLEAHIESLRHDGGLANVAKIGTKAPDFAMKNQRGETVTLSDLLAKGPLVFSFTRGSWCPYCAEEVSAWNATYADLKATGGELVVVSPQGPVATQKQGAEQKLNFSLLSDSGNEIGKAYGVAYNFTDELRKVYEMFKLDIPAINEAEGWTLPSPARFIISKDGIIRDVKVDPDYRYRPEPAEAVEIVKGMVRKTAAA